MNERILAGLAAPDRSIRLRAAMAAGTEPDVALLDALIARCAVDPDFYVRDMLTWALCRLPADVVVPRLMSEVMSSTAQASSQSLHTLSKIGDRRAWPAVRTFVHDEDDEVARTAWRAAVALVPDGAEAELAADLARELGRGDEPVMRSLSRALVGTGEAVVPVLDAADDHPSPRVRAHAAATRQLWHDPESAFVFSQALAHDMAADADR